MPFFEDFNDAEFEEIVNMRDVWSLDDAGEPCAHDYDDHEYYSNHGYSSGFLSNIGPSLADEENMFYDDY